MSKKIVTLPHPRLRERSKRVAFVDDSIKELIHDMEQATLDWEDSREHEVGVALAAVQIDEHKRVVIIRSDFNDKNNRDFEVFINPEIVKYEGKIEEDFEGCLSVKDIYGKVPRHTKVKIRAKNVFGNDVRITAEGFLARVFQHEIDHTNGMLFVDRIQDSPDRFYKLTAKGSIERLSDEEQQEQFSILW